MMSTRHYFVDRTASTCLEVRRSDTGTYDIPGNASPEDLGEVAAALAEAGAIPGERSRLRGWGRWTEVREYRIPGETA